MTSRPLRHARRLRRRAEDGYAAVMVALLSSVLFLGMAAMGVDTARWYVELEKVQKAADAAALAGVTYMPNDFDRARTTALAAAAKNGYDCEQNQGLPGRGLTLAYDWPWCLGVDLSTPARWRSTHTPAGREGGDRIGA